MFVLLREMSTIKQLQLVLFVAIFIAALTISFFVHKDVHLVHLELNDIASSEMLQDNASSLPCLILLWAHIPIDVEIPKTCICGGGCEITRDKTKLEDASAVVFMMKLLSEKDLPDPKRRKQGQVYIWFNRESSSTTKQVYYRTLKEFDYYFNWTMSYRLDADVDAAMLPFTAIPFIDELYERRRYFFRTNLSFKQDKDPANACKFVSDNKGGLQDIKKKSKLVAWAVYNCGGTRGANTRLKIVNRLKQQGLNVDMFGKCGGNKTRMSREPFFDTLSKYKFYLGFENSFHCKQYVTEKLWYNAFYLGSLPIVWGPTKKDIAEVAPAHSYIHYEDFRNESSLIKYIKFLDKNHTAYMEYFAWRRNTTCPFPLYKVNYQNYLDVDTNYATGFIYAYCRLCKMLRQGTHLTTRKTISSLYKYWYGNENSECLRR